MNRLNQPEDKEFYLLLINLLFFMPKLLKLEEQLSKIILIKFNTNYIKCLNIVIFKEKFILKEKDILQSHQ